MKRIFFKFITIILFLASSFLACSKEKEDLLANTWKLAGFVDAETNILREAEPIGDNCYTLTFDKWGKFSGRSSSNYFEGKYKINYNKNKISLSMSMETEVGEFQDGNLYMDILPKVDFFSVQGNELKLYHNNKQNYLLYKSKKS
jgi:hypothetical protein